MTLEQGWRLRDALNAAGDLLAGISEDSAVEAAVLLSFSLKIDRVKLFLDYNRRLTPEQFDQFHSLVARRIKGEPVAYITGHREFYGLDFEVDASVLIPRPETELLVGKALDIAKRRRITTIADIGTGSGAVAVSLATNLPNAKIYALDISPAALKVAERNCLKHDITERIRLLEGDLLSPLPEPVDMITANLPYVKTSDLAGVNTRGYEPELALDGGADGLGQIRRLISQAPDKLRPGGHILLEVGAGQDKAVAAILRSSFPTAEIKVFKDLAGVGRVVKASV